MDTSSLMEQILSSDNLNRAYLQVVRNKGAEGGDGMKYTELKEHLIKNGEIIKEQLRTRKYKPQPVRRVEIPKPDGGVRNLGVPTVTDRFIQQAIAQVLTPIYEEQFHDHSYGFRLNGMDEGTYRYDRKNATVLASYESKERGRKKSRIKYDKGGNPVSYLGMKLSWSHGRNLSGIKGKNTAGDRISAGYVYDKDGIRLSKTVNGKATRFITNGSTILTQVTGDEMLSFHYDSEGKLVEIGYSEAGGAETEYVVERNALGDVSALYTTGGMLVGTYSYDPYGRLLEAKTAEGYNDEHDILIKNPFRYRGYYYDSETGWYYLNSRYYDPNIKRFINADDPSYLGAGDEINSYNLFAYCGGDPVNHADENGKSPLLSSLLIAKTTVDIVWDNYAITVGIGGSGGLGVGGCGGVQLSYCKSGELALQCYYGSGATTGARFGIAASTGFYPNIETTDELLGIFTSTGGSVADGMGIGADFMAKDQNNNFAPAGVSVSFLAGDSAEGHVWITDTKPIVHFIFQEMGIQVDVPTWP